MAAKNRGNAGKGRAKGTPNRVTKALKEMILGALDEAHEDGGQAYLAEQANANPQAFMALLGRVLPTTLAGDPNAPLRQITEIRLVPLRARPAGNDS